jgi:hypothetical protein
MNVKQTISYVELLKRVELTPNQYFFCICVQYKNNKDFKETVLGSFLQGGFSFSEKEVQTCIDKGYIEDFNFGDTKSLNNYHLTNLFSMKIQAKDIDREQIYEDLISSYPPYTEINGKQAALTVVKDRDLLLEKYLREIDYNIETHNKIINIIKQASKLKLISYSLYNFIESKMWIALETQLPNRSETGLDNAF